MRGTEGPKKQKTTSNYYDVTRHTLLEIEQDILKGLFDSIDKYIESKTSVKSVDQVVTETQSVQIDYAYTMLDMWKAKIEQALSDVATKWNKHVWEDKDKWRDVANLLMEAVFGLPEYDPDIVKQQIPKFVDAYRYLLNIVDQNLPNFTNIVLISDVQYKKLFRAIPTLAQKKEKLFLQKYFEAMSVIDPKLKRLSYNQLWFVSSVYYPAKLAPAFIVSLLPNFTDYANLVVMAFYITMAKLFASKFRQHVRYVDKNLWSKALELVSSASKLKQYQFDYVRMFKTLAQQVVYSWYLRKIAEGKIKAIKEIHIELYNKATAPARVLIGAYYRVYEAYKSGQLGQVGLTGDKAEEQEKEKEFTLADIPNTIQLQVQEALRNFIIEFEPDKQVIEYVWLKYLNKQLGKDTVSEIARQLHDTRFSRQIETIVSTIIVKSGLSVLSRQYRDKLVETAIDLLNSKDVATLAYRRAVHAIYEKTMETVKSDSHSKQTESLVKKFIVAYISVWITEHI